MNKKMQITDVVKIVVTHRLGLEHVKDPKTKHDLEILCFCRLTVV